MMMLRLTAIFLCSGLASLQAAESVSRTIIGTDPALSDGVHALRLRNYEEGLRLTLQGMKSALSIRNRAGALSNLCAGYLGTQQIAEALDSCNKAIELNDRNWRTFNNRALVLLDMGRIAAAREDVDKGLALNPDSTNLAKVAGMVDERARSRLVASDRPIKNP